jgi:hypothetical protein
VGLRGRGLSRGPGCCHAREVIKRLLYVVVAALAVGAITSWAQGFLPDALSSLANSPSGWTLLTALVVAAVRPSLPEGALLGVVAFVAMVLGYTFASELRGLSYSPLRWGLIGVLAGPFIGASAAALVSRGRAPLAAAGAGILGGVLVADGIYGLTVVDDTTSPVYWTVMLVLGFATVVVTGYLRRTVVALTVLAGVFVVTVGFLTLAYRVLNVIG